MVLREQGEEDGGEAGREVIEGVGEGERAEAGENQGWEEESIGRCCDEEGLRVEAMC